MKHLLTKSQIPVITPDPPNNSPNIVERAYSAWEGNSELDLDGDLLNSDGIIRENRIFIEASVFDLYDLTESDIKKVLDIQDIGSDLSKDILEVFRSEF